MLTALLAIQATAHAKDEPKKEPRTWGQAAWDNRYNIAGGAAVAGAGVAGYVFRNELMDIYNNMSPAQQEQVKADVQESINNDLQVIAEKQAVVAEQTAELKGMTEVKKHTAAEQKDIAQKEAMVVQKLQETAKIEKQINNKQGWWEWLTDPVRRANDPALKRIQAEINAHNNDWAEFQNEQEPRQMSDEEVLQQNEAIKAAYIAKYGNVDGTKRFKDGKYASDLLPISFFITSIAAVIAPAPVLATLGTGYGTLAILNATESDYNRNEDDALQDAKQYLRIKEQVQNQMK